MTNVIGTGGPNVPVGGVVKTAAPAPAPVAPAQAPAPVQPAAAAQPAASMNWGPSAVNLAGVTVPPMWPVGNAPVEGRTFSSWGDPHETTGDGVKFDNCKIGEFVKLMSASGDLALQTRHSAWGGGVAVNTVASVLMGDDVVVLDIETNTFTLNGKDVPRTPGMDVTLPGGTRVQIGEDGAINLTSAKGDKMSISEHEHKNGNYLNISGELGPDRKTGEVRGSLGSFDNDTNGDNDLLGRSGNAAFNAKSADSLKGFFDEWRVNPAESLISRSMDLKLFNMFDADGDGVADADTTNSYLKEKFDIDGDGKITRNEMIVAQAARRAGLASSAAPGGQGAAAAAGSLARFDANRDGKTTAAEYFKATAGWDIGAFVSRNAGPSEEDIARERTLQRKLDDRKADERLLAKRQLEQQPETNPAE